MVTAEGKMKKMNFRDQINLLTSWFKEWSECEQTVALYTLLKRVNASQARFLDLVLEQTLAESEEYIQLEREANNPAFIGSLHTDEMALPKLLAHLPLLQPGSIHAKAEYMKMIPKILTLTTSEGLHYEESKQLLSYFMIHPAITREERDSLSKWFIQLEERSTSQGHLSPDNSSPPSPSPTPDAGRLVNKANGWHSSRDSGIADTSSTTDPSRLHNPVENTVSAPPAVNVHGPHNETIESSPGGFHPAPQQGYQGRRSLPITPNTLTSHGWCSQDDYLHPPTDHAPLSPTSSGSSTEAHSEDGHLPLQKKNSFLEENSGMREVPGWLKRLRLHKYNSVFQQLSYDEMMELNEEKLKAMGITEGARNKILRKVSKLRERQKLLQELEKSIMDDNPNSIIAALVKVREEIEGTPLKRYEPPTPDADTVPQGDLPGQLTRFLGKVCSKILVDSRRPDEESIATYIEILKRYIDHEAFTDVQKKRLMLWRDSCQNFTRNVYPRKQAHDRAGRTWSHHGSSFPNEYALARSASTGRQPLSRSRPAAFQATHPPSHMQHKMLSVSGAGGVYRPTQSGSVYVQPRQGGPTRTAVSRTKSVPPHALQHGSANLFSGQHPPLTRVETPIHSARQSDLNNRQVENQLEKICLSVTQHALEDGPNDQPSNQ